MEGMIEMDRFIGRRNELSKLNELYNQPGFHMAVIYGRRRIGKSTLIKEFIKDKKAIYYITTKISRERNVELLSKEIFRVLSPELSSLYITNLDDLLTLFTQSLGDEKIVFVIDEIPYWAEKNESMLTTLQKFMDEFWVNKNLLLILCGSALSFMESKVLSEKSPLFGRRNIQIKLEAFNYMEAADFVPNYTYEEKAICYGMTGGVAKYLSLFSDTKSLDENIIAQFFDKNGYLFDETRNLLTQEFTDIAIVNSIIEQIAAGENTLNLIADKVHEKNQTVAYNLNKLINVGIVEKKKSITEEKNKKKVQYALKDSMFRFWYSFIPAAVSAIEMDRGSIYYEKVVKPQLHAFMGKVFEEMCIYYTLQIGLEGQLKCFVTRTGSWWGTELIEDEKGKRIQSADVDVVGLAPGEKAMVVGECKFKNEKIDKSIFETLQRRSKAIPTNFSVVQFLLFSLSGFSDWFATVLDNRIMTITLDEMYQIGANN